MKVTFEGTLTEIKKEIAIFLWEGSIWATKEEIETRLEPTPTNHGSLGAKCGWKYNWRTTWNTFKPAYQNLLIELCKHEDEDEDISLEMVEEITSLSGPPLGGILSTGRKRIKGKGLPIPLDRIRNTKTYKIDIRWRRFIKDHLNCK